MVPLIRRNIDLNIPPPSPAAAAAASSSHPPPATATAAARAAGYAWGGSKAALGAEVFDVILMADVVYDPKYYSALVQALRDLSHAGTVVTLAHRERHPDAALFFEVRGREVIGVVGCPCLSVRSSVCSCRVKLTMRTHVWMDTHRRLAIILLWSESLSAWKRRRGRASGRVLMCTSMRCVPCCRRRRRRLHKQQRRDALDGTRATTMKKTHTR